MELTKAQKGVLEELRKDGMFLWNNEGANFKAWIGDGKAKKVKGVRVQTAEILLTNGYLKFVDGDYPSGLYKYEISEKVTE